VIPTGRLVLLAVAPIVLGGAAVAFPSLVAPMLALDLTLAVVFCVDVAMSRAHLRVARRVEPVLAVGRPVRVALSLHNDGRRAVRVRVVDEAPMGLAPAPMTAVVGPGDATEVVYTVSFPERGAHRFGRSVIRWRSRLGLFERQLSLGEPSEVRVYPSFRQLRSWGVRAREDERRAPVRARRKPGGENEFERLRPYVRGDSYRHVDWRATARRRALITREFGQESNQNVLFLVDAGRMMSASSQGRSLFDHALDAALVLGQVALRNGDRVGLLAYDDRVLAWQPPRGGARQGVALIRGTYDVFPSLREPDHAMALRWVGQRVRRRSLVILLTSVIDTANAEATAAVTGILGRRHLPLCVWLRDPSLEELVSGRGAKPADPYVAGAAAELLLERSRQLAVLRERGALVLDADPPHLTSALLSRYLEIKARRLL
jgi:uncharacterized protein (DUF58 family)